MIDFKIEIINHFILSLRLKLQTHKGDSMLWTIFVILLVLWLLGMISAYTLGGFIHILLIIALVVLVIRLIQGKRVL